MAPVVKKKRKGAVSPAALLVLSVASSSERRRCYRVNKDGVEVPAGCGSKYETYRVSLRKPPNADAMDDVAWRRWFESFLPTSADLDGFMGDHEGWRHLHESFLTDTMDDDEPRFFDCYTGYDNTCFLFVGLTGLEPLVVANKPGVLRMSTMMGLWVGPDDTPCSRNASVVRTMLRSDFEIY